MLRTPVPSRMQRRRANPFVESGQDLKNQVRNRLFFTCFHGKTMAQRRIDPMKLKLSRTQANLSQEALAQKAQVSIATIRLYEGGKNHKPNLTTLDKLAQALHCQVEDFLIEWQTEDESYLSPSNESVQSDLSRLSRSIQQQTAAYEMELNQQHQLLLALHSLLKEDQTRCSSSLKPIHHRRNRLDSQTYVEALSVLSKSPLTLETVKALADAIELPHSLLAEATGINLHQRETVPLSSAQEQQLYWYFHYELLHRDRLPSGLTIEKMSRGTIDSRKNV